MSSIGRLFLRLARWIAGARRSEWADAMENEAVTLGGDSIRWTVGCAIAALKDRVWRERIFLLAILVLPLGAVLVELASFFPVVWLSRGLGLPNWTFVVVMAFAPLPFAYALGFIRPEWGAFIAMPVCFVIFHAVPPIVHWIQFGTPLLSWYGEHATLYMMPPFAGLFCSFLIWLTGVWLGSRGARASEL